MNSDGQKYLKKKKKIYYDDGLIYFREAIQKSLDPTQYIWNLLLKPLYMTLCINVFI